MTKGLSIHENTRNNGRIHNKPKAIHDDNWDGFVNNTVCEEKNICYDAKSKHRQ